ncbi:Dihydrofolate reductase [Haloechinothrix alba]|uniref:Dihydrofolate reductase n=1 Tax=Haloechinothrix alba TaxID=664784 RepID=A0A238ZXB4_9PSEU|nr:dihydrofolate reductase family protein [Haloechinothrix alba]SNR87293.1 Dihydrofolate reductase [Haloechinothrix alba]
MRKLVVGTFLSLDGVMQAPGGPDEDRDGGFEHGGWLVPHFDDQLGQLMDEWIARCGVLLLGRKTYEIFAAHWPRVSGDTDPVAATLNSVPKYVATRTLDTATWHNTTLLSGDVAEQVGKLKQQPGGEIQVHGSGNLTQTLMANDLVDEHRLTTFPVVLGSGKRLFADGAVPRAFTLAETTTTSTGVTVTRYERAGRLEHGSFALD